MISEATEKKIISECRRLCETFRLDQVYLAEVVGPRRHYLAGYGQNALEKPRQRLLSPKVALLWHGSLPSEIQDICERYFLPLTEQVERELVSRRCRRTRKKVQHRQQ